MGVTRLCLAVTEMSQGVTVAVLGLIYKEPRIFKWKVTPVQASKEGLGGTEGKVYEELFHST